MKGACGSSIQKLHIFKEIRYALKEKKVLKNLVHKRKACSYQTRPPACRTFKRKKSLQAEKFLRHAQRWRRTPNEAKASGVVVDK